MSTVFIISLVINIGLIILCLSMIYPKAIQVYKNRKKLRETQANKERKEFIRKVVIEYLEELQK